MIDANKVADSIERMIKKSNDNTVSRMYKRGVVATINGQYADVYIEGNPVSTKGILSLDSYTPKIGDKVLVLSIGDSGANQIILGGLSG